MLTRVDKTNPGGFSIYPVHPKVQQSVLLSDNFIYKLGKICYWFFWPLDASLDSYLAIIVKTCLNNWKQGKKYLLLRIPPTKEISI